jgi:hypothetical protein
MYSNKELKIGDRAFQKRKNMGKSIGDMKGYGKEISLCHLNFIEELMTKLSISKPNKNCK